MCCGQGSGDEPGAVPASDASAKETFYFLLLLFQSQDTPQFNTKRLGENTSAATTKPLVSGFRKNIASEYPFLLKEI